VDRRSALGVALVLVSAAGFGSGALFAKPVYDVGVGWLVLSSWRFLFGAALAWAWLLAWPNRRRGLRALGRPAAVASVALGLLYVGNSATYYAGLETVPASLAALIVYVYPAVVAVLSLRIGRRLEGRRAWAALGIALLGVALTVGGIDPGSVPPLFGLVLIVVSPLIYSVWIVLSARLSGERRETVGHASDAGAAAAAATALMMSATATVYWFGAVAGGEPVFPADIPASAWPGMLGVGCVATFIAIQAFYEGARRVGAAQAALISTFEPVWTITLAAVLLSESLTPLQLAGGALILVGVVLAQTGPAGRDAEPVRPPIRLADE
jgi:drug/metabolite transporter (DMT)-like permease